VKVLHIEVCICKGSKCLTDFKIDLLHRAGGFGDIDTGLIARIGCYGKNLRGEPDGAAVLVF
jgi:hypothetical protein